MINTLVLFALCVGEKLGLALRGSDEARCRHTKQPKRPALAVETCLEKLSCRLNKGLRGGGSDGDGRGACHGCEIGVACL